MNKNTWILCLILVGCGDGKEDDTDDGNSVFSETTDSGEIASDSDCPSDVPEQYQYSWDCLASSCPGGWLMYRNGIGESTADGRLAVEEKYYIFTTTQSCVDTFSVAGIHSDYNPSNFNCSNCEEIFEIYWQLTDSQCKDTMGWTWKSTFGDQESATDEYYGYLMFDTHNAFGDRNPENNILAIGAAVDSAEGSYSPMMDYARGSATPTEDGVDMDGDGGIDFYPSAFDWVNSGVCYTPG